MLYRSLLPAALFCALIAVAVPSMAATPAAEKPLDAKTYQQTLDRAVEYLKTKGQAADGSFNAQVGPGLTAVVTSGLLRNGLGPDDPVVAKGLKYLEGFIQKDGGVYRPGGQLENYETCLAIMCFTDANRDRRYENAIKAADKYLKASQWGDGLDKSDPRYGGGGYGKHKRPDLSNTSFLIDALKAAGNGPEDEAMKRALVFVSRCQNLETENNTTPFAAKNPDGGFYYTPVGEGESFAGKTADGGLRSYASMTYAGLKSMIYAGVGPEDPRVKAALKWAQMHYGLDSNPGIQPPLAGLYYYYHTFAKALDASGLRLIEDDKGVKHDWRRELLAELVHRQRPNGSWINEESKWLEGDPNLVTGYALLALAYCRPAVEK
jgi:squalene-hopene/tetraprenyl-beta-curcumene cyclase